MAKVRAEKTLADYVAIAISPILIMALAGSLAFFLLELAYSGQYAERMRWILFWFVFASVLVGRIAVEQGSEHAALFGVALAAVTGLAAFRLAPDGALPGLFVLAVIWWAVHRLTFDCTLIDDSIDASGEGLLQASGLDDEEEPAAQVSRPVRKKRPAWWKAVFGSGDASRAPGTWVVYFSVAALPLFGLGQLLIPAAQSGRRQFAFFLLLIYVASALGLLLTTSFLGLRRYLRQRRLAMPGTMAAVWMVAGVTLICGILGACFLLPRPDHSASPSDAWRQLADFRQKASDFAQMGNESGDGEGKRAGQPPEHQNPQQKPEGENGDQQPGDQPPEEGEKPLDPNGQQVQPGQGEPDDQKQGEPQADNQPAQNQQPGQGAQQRQQRDPQKNEQQGQKGEQKPPEQNQQGQNQQGQPQNEQQEQHQEQNQQANPPAEQQAAEPPQPEPQSPMLDPAEWFSWMGEHWRVVLWIVLGLAGSIFLIRNWDACLAFLGRLWAEFLALFGGRALSAAGATEDLEPEPTAPLRPFSEMTNPFATGDAQRMKPSEVLRVTFAALQAWARERGRPRRTDQTPLEFVHQLGAASSPVSVEAREVAQLYSRMIYAGHAPGREDLDVMSHLWRRMEAVSS